MARSATYQLIRRVLDEKVQGMKGRLSSEKEDETDEEELKKLLATKQKNKSAKKDEAEPDADMKQPMGAEDEKKSLKAKPVKSEEDEEEKEGEEEKEEKAEKVEPPKKDKEEKETTSMKDKEEKPKQAKSSEDEDEEDEVYAGPKGARAGKVYAGPDGARAGDVYAGPDGARAGNVYAGPEGAGVRKSSTKKVQEQRSSLYSVVMRVIEEGRGRPRKNPNDPKWQKKTANSDDSEEMEGLQPDSGREADQHIHVRLKAVTDSSEKGGADVTFDNGKKHFVKQNVAKTVLSALDKMKPEARKQIHDHIAQSHENLMQVHSMLTGKK